MRSNRILVLCFVALAAIVVVATFYLWRMAPPPESKVEIAIAQPADRPTPLDAQRRPTGVAPLDFPSGPARQVNGNAPSATVSPASPLKPATLPGAEPDLPALIKTIVETPIDETTRALTEDLLHGDADRRGNAISELGFLDDPRWVSVVVAVLGNDQDASVRSAAAAALATQSSSPAAAHALAQALTDGDMGVREDALLSLKAIRSGTVAQDLRRQLASGQLDEDTAREIRLFLDRYYVRKDPLYDPLDP